MMFERLDQGFWCGSSARGWPPYGDSLASIFAGIHPDRRQAYAK
jgi:hypothetical protein